jgi:small subunit ribosomal protein S36
VPAAVAAATVLFAVVLIAWTHLTPLAQAPDEQSHAALIELLADGRDYPEYDAFFPYEGSMNAWLAHNPGLGRLLPEDAPPRDRRPTLEGWGGRSRWGHANQITQHPPLYYQLAAYGLRAARALPGVDDQPLERERHLLRLGNVLLVAPLPLLGWAAARRLGADHTGATASAIVPLAIPQLAHIGGSINNDNLLILLSALLAVGLAGVVRGDVGRTTALGVGVITGLALWTKAFALVYLPWIGLAYALPVARDRRLLRRSLGCLAIAWGTALLIGAWWWVRNLVRHGEAFPTILDRPIFGRPEDFEADLVSYLQTYLPSMTHRFWGNFASYTAPMTPGLVLLVTLATAAALLVALAPARKLPSTCPRTVPARELAVYASVVPILAAMLFWIAYDRHRMNAGYDFIQGRYLFGALVPLMVVVGLGAARVLRGHAPLVLLAGAVVMQLDAARVVTRHLWAEPDASQVRSIDAMLAWGPWPPIGVYALTVVIMATTILTVVALRRQSEGDQARTGAPDPRSTAVRGR